VKPRSFQAGRKAPFPSCARYRGKKKQRRARRWLRKTYRNAEREVWNLLLGNTDERRAMTVTWDRTSASKGRKIDGASQDGWPGRNLTTCPLRGGLPFRSKAEPKRFKRGRSHHVEGTRRCQGLEKECGRGSAGPIREGWGRFINRKKGRGYPAPHERGVRVG